MIISNSPDSKSINATLQVQDRKVRDTIAATKKQLNELNDLVLKLNGKANNLLDLIKNICPVLINTLNEMKEDFHDHSVTIYDATIEDIARRLGDLTKGSITNILDGIANCITISNFAGDCSKEYRTACSESDSGGGICIVGNSPFDPIVVCETGQNVDMCTSCDQCNQNHHNACGVGQNVCVTCDTCNDNHINGCGVGQTSCAACNNGDNNFVPATCTETNCPGSYSSSGTDCRNNYNYNNTTNQTSCEKDYSGNNTVCSEMYSNSDGNESCASSFSIVGGEVSCSVNYTHDSEHTECSIGFHEQENTTTCPSGYNSDGNRCVRLFSTDGETCEEAHNLCSNCDQGDCSSDNTCETNNTECQGYDQEGCERDNKCTSSNTTCVLCVNKYTSCSSCHGYSNSSCSACVSGYSGCDMCVSGGYCPTGYCPTAFGTPDCGSCNNNYSIIPCVVFYGI